MQDRAGQLFPAQPERRSHWDKRIQRMKIKRLPKVQPQRTQTRPGHSTACAGDPRQQADGTARQTIEPRQHRHARGALQHSTQIPLFCPVFFHPSNHFQPFDKIRSQFTAFLWFRQSFLQILFSKNYPETVPPCFRRPAAVGPALVQAGSFSAGCGTKAGRSTKVILLFYKCLTSARCCGILVSLKFVWIFYSRVLLFATQWFKKAIVWLFCVCGCRAPCLRRGDLLMSGECKDL